MKCPKCLYIGFETGDRCKNCGYDFSLLALAEQEPVPLSDLPVHAVPAPGGAVLDLAPGVSDDWTGGVIDRFRDLPDADEPAMMLAGPAASAEPPAAPNVSSPVVAPADRPALPLFAPDAVDDEPLVKLPAVPRPPLAVRRTPETPRLRPPAAVERAPRVETLLRFAGEPDADPRHDPVSHEDRAVEAPPSSTREPAGGRRPPFRVEAAVDASPFGRRAAAAIIDHGLLLCIDLVVLYFTLRLTDLSFADWRVLPWLPLAAFLLSLKIAYLSAFTTAGGQTIGKMATNIRVVSDDGAGLDAGRALRRAVLELMSIATVGAPFLTAVADPARRMVHDRVSGTRVVALAPR
jgi:uncharacterized RDD family membrane protein YckC